MENFLSGQHDLPSSLRRAGAAAGPPRPRAPFGRAELFFCENCDTSIPTRAILDGSALALYGLTFCPACRHRVETGRSTVHFCDLCDRPIPPREIDSGTAIAADGRLVCAACRDRPAFQRLGRIALILLLLLIVIVCLRVIAHRLRGTMGFEPAPGAFSLIQGASSRR